MKVLIWYKVPLVNTQYLDKITDTIWRTVRSNRERKPDWNIEFWKIILADILIIVIISRARKLKVLFLRMTNSETFFS